MTQKSSNIARMCMELIAASATDKFKVVSTDKRETVFVKKGTKTATPKGAARSLKRPYIPVPDPAVSAGKSESTIFMKIAAFAPSPKPKIPREAARTTKVVVREKKSIRPQPSAVNRREPVKMRFGSYRSASGPKTMEPIDIPRYIMEIV